MKIYPTLPSCISTQSPKIVSQQEGKRELHQVASPVAAQIAELFGQAHIAFVDNQVAFLPSQFLNRQTQFSSFPESTASKLSQELDYLLNEKRNIQVQLQQAKSELAELMQGQTPPDEQEIRQETIKMLSEEQIKLGEMPSASRVYNDVLAEEYEMQFQSWKNDAPKILSKPMLKKLNDIDTEFRQVRDELHSLDLKFRESKELVLRRDIRNKVAELRVKKSTLWDKYNQVQRVYNNEVKIIKNGVDNRGIALNIFSNPPELVSKHALVEYLNKKSAMLEYCSKVTELYSECEWIPSEELISGLAGKMKNNVSDILVSADELSRVSKLISNVNDSHHISVADYASKYAAYVDSHLNYVGYLEKNLVETQSNLKKHIDSKYKYKQKTLTVPLYLFSKITSHHDLNKKIGELENIINKTRETLEASKEELIKAKTGQVDIETKLSASRQEKMQNESEIKNFFTNRLIAQRNMAMSCNDTLNKQLAYNKKHDIFTSHRIIDKASGLYHEHQFDNSGTCLLHATNHYLSAHAAGRGIDYLPLTPRRLDLLLNGIFNQQQTKIAKSLSDALHKNTHLEYSQLMEITRSVEKGIVSIREKYLSAGEYHLIDYNSAKESGGYFDADTGDFYSKGIISLLFNHLASRSNFNAFTHKSSEWKQQQSQLSELQRNNSQLMFIYHRTPAGHAMNFAKVGEQWFLQDSHFDAPVACSPQELIKHLNGEDDTESHLNRCMNDGYPVRFREHHGLDSASVVEFTSYSPNPA